MNQYLKDKMYKIPNSVLKGINMALISSPNAEGVKRAKTLLKNGSVTYQSLKRLKNYFDYFNTQSGDKIQYALAGGDDMRNFVEQTLNQERKGVKMAKTIKRDITTNPNSELKPYQTPRLNETGVEHLVRTIDGEIIKRIINESSVNKYAVAIILDNNNKFLLLKRGDCKEIWQPNKWSLAGGGVEKNESPEQAIKREIKEETGLEINKFIKSFSIQRDKDNIEYIFACRYDGDGFDVDLDYENSGYGWFSIPEIDYLDTVPHLAEYITMTFKPYDEAE